jgi:PDZ domain-containing protein
VDEFDIDSNMSELLLRLAEDATVRGTITSDGKVGPIGGVVEKIVGAKRVGAQVIFISTENCSELPATVEGISVVAVSTLAEALSYLRGESSGAALNSAGIHGCASVGA